jgi:hypothetical protein
MSHPTSREETIQSVVEVFVAEHLPTGCYSPTTFLGIFMHETLSQNQTLGMALAEWHALFASTKVFSLWNALGSNPDLVKDMVKRFQRGMMEAIKDTCQDEFINIINAREPEYFHQMKAALTSDTWMESFKLSGLTVRRITGEYEEAEESTGLHEPTDVSTSTVLWNLVVSDLKSTKDFLCSAAVQNLLASND